MLQNDMYLIVPFSTLIICQLLKFILEAIKNKKFDFARLFNGTGGMPSSHSAFTFSLTFTILFNEGVHSSLFAIALVFSIIVAYDAMGLRMESGRQAQAINMLYNELKEKNHVTLKEQLGHKPLEVLAGIILALIVSSVFQIKL